MGELAVANAWRLVEAGTGLHQHFADAFVLHLHPALQHVHELNVAIVPVPFAVRRCAWSRTDHVGDDLAARGAFDAKIAVLEVAAQSALDELRSCSMPYRKSLRPLFRGGAYVITRFRHRSPPQLSLVMAGSLDHLVGAQQDRLPNCDTTRVDGDRAHEPLRPKLLSRLMADARSSTPRVLPAIGFAV